MNKKAILIGYGSVGKKHLENLEMNGYSVDICEVNLKLISKLKKQDYFVKNKLNKFKKNTYELAVIASWGPDHFQHFKDLTELKVKKIIIEKPLCASEVQIKSILKISQKKKIKFVVHHKRKYNDIQKNIIKIFNLYKDVPYSAFVHGGSTCSITTGIHFLSLVCEIFDEIPYSVYSDIINDKINPRHEKLGYWSGTSIYYFKKKKFFTISNTNQSPIKNTLSIYGKKIRVDLIGNKIFYGKIKKKIKKITNHQLVEANQFNFNINKNYYREMLKRLDNTKTKEMRFNGLVMKTILRGLCSSLLKKKVNISTNMKQNLFKKNWPVS